MAWKPLGNGDARLWIPGRPVPFNVRNGDFVYAHNIQFDYRVWHILGAKLLFPPFKLSQCVDTMALCGKYTYPQKLEFAGKVLRLPVQKDMEGKKLMNKICKPPYKYTNQELNRFYRYCLRDVLAMEKLIYAMPKDRLTPDEQLVWEATAKINFTGLPIDIESVHRVYNVTEAYKKKRIPELKRLTNGMVQTPGQVQAIRHYAETRGVDLPNLQADTVADAIERDEDFMVTSVLKLRQELGRTSTAKYRKLIDEEYNGRIYDNLRYYAASTGRWGGMGFQLQNLPRAKVDDPEAAIKGMHNDKDPITTAKALIRSMIKAPDGYKILAADYTAIENILLLWVADEQGQLSKIRKGLEHYKLFAASVYGVDYADVDEYQRFLGKVGVLGAGYNAGGGGFLKFALGYGIEMDLTEAQDIINLYRRDHPNVKSFWYAVRDCAIAAIQHRGARYGHNGCVFKVAKDRNGMRWLTIKLPSGRVLVYNSPELSDDVYGLVPTHMGINSYTKQWSRLKLIPGRITENIVQALARDVLAGATLRLQDAGYQIIGSVHDEMLALERCGSNHTLERMIKIMTMRPTWAPDLPLSADGFAEERYRK